MKKDIEYQAGQIDLLKQDEEYYIKRNELKYSLEVMDKDTIMRFDDKHSKLSKDLNYKIDEKLKILDGLPLTNELVKKKDFQRFVESFRAQKDSVDRVANVLLAGYKNEANHALNSKISRTELEDCLKQKFEHDRGKELEKDAKRLDKKV